MALRDIDPRSAYLSGMYSGSTSGSSTSSPANAPNYPGNQTYTSTGTPNFGSNVNTTFGVGTNVSGIADKKLIDPKLDEDAGVYEANQDLFDTLKDTYTSPTDTYGTGSGLDFVTVDAGTVDDLGFFDQSFNERLIFNEKTGKYENNPFFLSNELLEFYGVDPESFNVGSGSLSIPKELYQMLAEGSIVTPMEAMNPAQLKMKDKDGNIISVDENVGTFADLEAGIHPLLGGIDKYYKIMSGDTFPQPATGGGGGGSYGGGGDYAAYLGAGLPMSPKQLGDEENVPAQAQLLQYMVNLHKGNPYTKLAMRKKSGGIVSLVGG